MMMTSNNPARWLVLLWLLSAVLASGQELPRYSVQRTTSRISIDAKLNEPAWNRAPLVGDFFFNRWKEGEKEKTDVRLLWDDKNLYVAYYCHDRHISASVTQRHGPVSRDDCVEIFLSPNPQKVRNYYTFEINAIGTMLNRCKTDWWKGAPTWEPEGVKYRTSLQRSRPKQESAADHDWTVELAIPFKNFARDAAHVPPRDGDTWRINLYRTGGITNRQSSSWSPLPAGVNFHTPEAFGWIEFSTRR